MDLKNHTTRLYSGPCKCESFICDAGDRNIKSLKTKCDNAANGCEWIGELGSITEHSNCCNYTLLPCPNKCRNHHISLQDDKYFTCTM